MCVVYCFKRDTKDLLIPGLVTVQLREETQRRQEAETKLAQIQQQVTQV